MDFLKRIISNLRSESHAWLPLPERDVPLVDAEKLAVRSKLPQVHSSSRLIATPAAVQNASNAFAGGDPFLPDDVDWPKHEGEPWVFVCK